MAKIRLQTRYTLLCYIIQFTAARLKGDVREKHRLSGDGQRLEEAAAGEILRVGVVRLAETEEAAVRFNGAVVGVDLLRHAERRPRIRPAGIKRSMGENFSHLAAGHAVRARGGEMIFEGRIGYPLADECGYGHDGAQAGAYNKNLFGHIILRMYR